MRILVVEDDSLLQRSLAASLRDENYAVDTADNGEDGLAKAQEGSYDAIVLDVMMPVLDGWEMLARLRERHTTPVLMLTARDTVPDRVKGLDCGADDYLTKPFDTDELLARLRAIIRRSIGQPKSQIVLGDLIVDCTAKRASLDGKPVPLTAREYSLLEYLAMHQGEVVSRSDLYEHLFDENDQSLSNLLDVHVSNLRKKLGHELITTRRGQGYCIE
jgi:two-component system OmpR family response regulator